MSSGTAVVLGGYVNAYGIVRSLHEAGCTSICVIDNGRSATRWSRYVTDRRVWDGDPEQLVQILSDVAARYGYLTPFPTADRHVEILAEYASSLREFCFIPINESNATKNLDKSTQYEVAKSIGIGVPRSVVIRSLDALHVQDLSFPVILKPVTREDLVVDTFRNLVLQDHTDLELHQLDVEHGLAQGVAYLVSELIPGDSASIYAYTAYRGRDQVIRREWGGRKLTQHPDDFGVYSTASNEIVDGLFENGRALVAALDAYGIVEPEFKLDPRDGQLKLMEVNLRSMMWHRVGALAGVNLPQAQMLDAAGEAVPAQRARAEFVSHVYFGHEVSNLIGRPNYAAKFTTNVLSRRKREWAFFNISDPGPFVRSTATLGKLVMKACRRRLARS